VIRRTHGSQQQVVSSPAPGTVDYGRKWYAMAAVGVGVLLATIDGSIVNIALPTIRADLETSLPVVQWVSVAYLLTLASLTLGVGRWGDIVGKKRIYLAGFVLFTLASALCGAAPSIGFLIGFRVIQAMGAVMILALGAAILTEAFPPEERGKALGLIGTFVSVGIVIGPMVGGLILATLDWRAIFFVNLPVGIVGTWMVIRFVASTAPAGGQRFDLPGAILLALALLTLSLGVIFGQDLGYGAPPVVSAIVAGAVLVAAFLGVERRSPTPMLPLRMFRNPLLSVSVSTGFLAFSALSATFFLLPFYLEGVLGFDLPKTGLALSTAPLVIGVVAPLAGALSDRMGVRRLTLAGLTIMGLAYLGFQTFDTDTSFLGFALVAIPIGLGIGTFQSPNNSAIMGSVSREYAGVAGGMLTLTRLLGQIAGVAAIASLWATRVRALAGPDFSGDAVGAPHADQVRALHETALVMAGIIAVAMLIGWYGLRQERAARQSGISGG
jgi:EmrB/QacA subfamily drug resistance transporter